jgi:hypothetical protein
MLHIWAEKTMLYIYAPRKPCSSSLARQESITTGRLGVLDRKEYMGLHLGYRFNGPERIATSIFDPSNGGCRAYTCLMLMGHEVCRKKETLAGPRLIGAYGLGIQMCKTLKMFFFLFFVPNKKQEMVREHIQRLLNFLEDHM